MSRKKSFANKSTNSLRVQVDYKFDSGLVSKLINYVMKDGKKSIAEQIVYEALEIVAKETNSDPIIFLTEMFENIRPLTEVRSRRIGGATYQIPTEVRTVRSFYLARKWLTESTRARKELPKFISGEKKYKVSSFRLANEIIAAHKSEGATFKRKENLMKMVEANKAFSHLKY
jgi:small subunit ribosomal protein S7